MKVFFLLLTLTLVLACGRSPEDTAANTINRRLRAGQPLTAIEVADEYLRAHPNAAAIEQIRFIARLKAGQSEQAYAAFPTLPAGAAALEEALTGPDAELRRVVAWFIGTYRIGSVKRDCLLDGLNDAEPGVRAYCARALGRLDPDQSARALYGCLQDGDWLVRAEAATALGQVRDERVVGWLTILLGDSDGYVRFSVMQALASRPRSRTVALLAEMLSNVKPSRRLSVALALARLGETNGVPAIAVALQTERTRLWAIEAVRDLPVPMATNLLQAVVGSSNPVVRQQARNAWVRVLSQAPVSVMRTTFAVAPL